MNQKVMNIIITAGDCNGIGIETLAKSLANPQIPDVRYAICCNKQTLAEYAAAMQLDVKIKSGIATIGGRECTLLECNAYAPVEFGKTTILAGKLAFEQLERAATALYEKQYDALVTLPVSKFSLRQAGWKFPGQTEMLAKKSGNTPMMILTSGNIRVALQTIHLPLGDVVSHISQNKITGKILSFHETLCRDFCISKPRIAVLGLNPHAGENGSIGAEEITIIAPSIAEAALQGSVAEGPFPADGFFAFGEYLCYDGILAMYHDQGLIPLKLLARGGGVNVTAGLPVVRTSPDHGTAFGIAGKGAADETSTVEAIKLAVSIVEARRKFHS